MVIIFKKAYIYIDTIIAQLWKQNFQIGLKK